MEKGSTFYLTIIAEQAQAHEGNAEKAMQHLSILLVEDVELNVVVAKSILEKQGHYVDVAMNGEQAINYLRKILMILFFLILSCQICQVLILHTIYVKTTKKGFMIFSHL